MTQTNGIPQLQFRRVNPYQGLMIDAAVWQDAHEYHRNQMRLHHLALHGWGIVQGLEIDVAADNALTIRPGVAIDPNGNFVIVNQATPFHVETREAGAVYLVLQFREVLTGPTQIGIEGMGPPTRIAEVYQIQQRERASEEPSIELARIDFDPKGKPISLPANPERPGKNEIDLRHRPRLGHSAPTTSNLLLMAAAEAEPLAATQVAVAQSSGDHNSRPGPAAVTTAAPSTSTAAAPARRLTMALARHAGDGWDLHLAGLANLSREIGATFGINVPAPLTLAVADAEAVDVLYFSGQSRLQLSDADVAAAARLLGLGGMLVAEGCASGPNGDAGAREFALSFVELADRLGRQLSDVQRGHALMNSRHVFAIVPAGARERARVLEANGIVYSDADYGCAWQGGPSDRPLVRGVIRDALEFGINIVALRHPERPVV
jgi:hypothetical protein